MFDFSANSNGDLTVERRKQPRDWQQRFTGLRVNCESVPRLPGWAVRRAMNDPRRIPYQLLWRNRDEAVKEALQVFWRAADEWVEVKRTDGSRQRIRTGLVEIPNGASALLLYCSRCGSLRRHLYGWEVLETRLTRSLWQCRTCAGLRYASEGLYIPLAFRGWGRLERRPTWDPRLLLKTSQDWSE
jgi:hypothetical protein